MKKHELMDDGGPVLEIDGDTARPVGVEARVSCPECEGTGSRMCSFLRQQVPCGVCDASGIVLCQRLLLVRFGRRLRDARRREQRDLKAEAARLRITAQVLIYQERALICPCCRRGWRRCRCTLAELEQAARAAGRLP